MVHAARTLCARVYVYVYVACLGEARGCCWVLCTLYGEGVRWCTRAWVHAPTYADGTLEHTLVDQPVPVPILTLMCDAVSRCPCQAPCPWRQLEAARCSGPRHKPSQPLHSRVPSATQLAARRPPLAPPLAALWLPCSPWSCARGYCCSSDLSAWEANKAIRKGAGDLVNAESKRVLTLPRHWQVQVPPRRPFFVLIHMAKTPTRRISPHRWW